MSAQEDRVAGGPVGVGIAIGIAIDTDSDGDPDTEFAGHGGITSA